MKPMPATIRTTVFQALFNAWPTSRRFQQHAPCVVRCGHREDSLEHYFECNALRMGLVAHLRPFAEEIPHPASMWNLISLLDSTDHGARAGVWIDIVLQSARICRHTPETCPAAAAASRLKTLLRRWPTLKMLLDFCADREHSTWPRITSSSIFVQF